MKIALEIILAVEHQLKVAQFIIFEFQTLE